MHISFEVLGQPVGKQRPRVAIQVGYAHAYTPDKTVDYENFVKMSYIQKFGKFMIDKEKPIYMQVFAYYKIPKNFSKKKQDLAENGTIKPTVKPDLDNVIKAICDALNGIAYSDDNQIVSIFCSKSYSKNPRVRVELNY